MLFLESPRSPPLSETAMLRRSKKIKPPQTMKNKHEDLDCRKSPPKGEAQIALRSGANLSVVFIKNSFDKFHDAFDAFLRGAKQTQFTFSFLSKDTGTSPDADQWISVNFDDVIAITIKEEK